MKMKHYIYISLYVLSGMNLVFKLINNAVFSENGKQFENSTKLALPKGFFKYSTAQK